MKLVENFVLLKHNKAKTGRLFWRLAVCNRSVGKYNTMERNPF